MAAQDETQVPGTSPPPNSDYSLGGDILIYALSLAAAIIQVWMLRDGKLDTISDYGRFSARFIYALFISFVVGFIVAKCTARVLGHKPWVARMGFALGNCFIVALLLPTEHHPGSPPTQQILGKSESEALLMNEGRTFATAAQQRVVKYRADYSAIAGEHMIGPAQLDTPPKISALRAKLTQLRNLTDKLEIDTQVTSDAFLRRIQTLSIDDERKRRFIAGFAAGQKDKEATARESLALIRQTYDECEKLADFMSSRFGEFKVVDKNVVFNSAQDLAEFQRIFERLNEIRKRQLEIAATAEKFMREAEQELK